MAERQTNGGANPQVHVILPDGQRVSLEFEPAMEHRSPLAGPPDLPEPDLSPRPDYGPNQPVKGHTRGFFLDRYVY